MIGLLKRSSFVLPAIILALSLEACGGGGGGGGAIPLSPGGTTALLNVPPKTSGPTASPTPAASGSPSPVPSASPIGLLSEMPKMSDSLVDVAGVNSHFGYTNTPYYSQWPTISANLVRSGFRHIRDGRTNPSVDELTKMAYLGRHGINHSLFFGITDPASLVVSSLKQQMPYVDYVEPANEYDGYRFQDPNWATELQAEQQMLWNTRNSDPAFAAISVAGPAMTSINDYATLGPLDAMEDAGNLHWTTCALNPGNTAGSGHNGFPFAESFAILSTQTKPMYTTETGYTDDPSVTCALPDDIIAKYDPRMIAERFNAGDKRAYFYQLADMPTDPHFGAEGLLDASGNPKPQFTAVSSLLRVLTDPGASFNPTPLSYALHAPANVHHSLLQKRNGTYELLLWQEAAAWKSNPPDNYGGVRTPVPAVAVTLTTPSASVVNYFQYGASSMLGRTAFAVGPSGTTTLNVTDSISVVELH